MSTQRWLLSLFLVLALLASGATTPTPAQAGGVVTVCDEAHLLAALAGGGAVTFACSGTIVLTNTITIAADTTIDGTGQAITISGNHTVGVFIVNPGATLNLNKLTIADGSANDGGGMYGSQGSTLNVSHCMFSGNSATLTHGGSIYNDGGTLSIDSSFFSGNTAGNSGGAIENGWAGVAAVTNSTFTDNSSGSYGGAISNWQTGSLIVSNSTFSGNRVLLWGGAISTLHYSTLSVSNSTFHGNSGMCQEL